MNTEVTIKSINGIEVAVNPLFRNSNVRRVKIWTNGENSLIEPFSFVGICAEEEQKINLPTAIRIPILPDGRLFKIEFDSDFHPEYTDQLYLNAHFLFWVTAHYEPLYVCTVWLTRINTEQALLSAELPQQLGLA